MRLNVRLAPAFAAFGTFILCMASCDWISLAKNSLNYRETKRGEVANVVVRDSLAYATAAEDGLLIINIRTGERLEVVAPASVGESIDDVAIADDFLFVLDAKIPGHISVYSLKDPAHPDIASPPLAVPVGPFSGISARDGWCIVSGGTAELTVWRYDSTGNLAGPIATSDFGRGQPDVLLDKSGFAYVSAHYWGPNFGIDIGKFEQATNEFRKLGSLELDGAGFTEGGAKPANFPIESALLSPETLLVAFAKGLAVVDVSLPDTPKLIKIIDVGGQAVNVDVLDRTAAVAVYAAHPSVAFVEFSSASDGSVRHIQLKPGTFPTGVALTDDYAVVAAHEQGVLIFELKASNQLIGG